MTYAAAPLQQTEDRAGLLALWKEVMASRTVDHVADWRFDWFFQQNPAGPPTVCVTHHVESHALVACGSAHPRRTQVGGELHSAGILGDFAVARSHRVAGAAMAVQRRLMTESLQRFDFIYGCPNKQAEPIFKRLGYQVIGATVSYSRLLRTADKLERFLKAPVLARLAGAVADKLLHATDLRVRLRHPFSYRDQLADRADPRFDALWTRARSHYGITGERTAAYLNWRYADFKTRQFRFFCLTRRGSGELVGYVVFSLQDNVVLVSDLFCDDPRSILEVLLVRFAGRMRDGKNRSIYLDLFADEQTGRTLRRLLFVKRADSRMLIARAREGAPAELTQQLMDAQRWFMISGELDT